MNLTQEQAIALAETRWWEGLPADAITAFQLYQDLLCMDSGAFHAAVEASLGRGVWTHEFADFGRLQAEFEGRRQKPTMQEIIDLFPDKARVILVVAD